MKMKWVLTTYAVISILALMLLLSVENVYVVIALAIGMLLLGHREVWSLIRYRRLPVIDERVRTNLTCALRITGVFFFIAGIVLTLMLRFNVFRETSTGLIISGQMVVVGLVYLVSYHYYDRVKPNLDEKTLHWLKRFMATAGLSLSTVALGIVLHNMIYAWFGVEDAVFFVLALLVAPAVLLVCLVGGIVIYSKGLLASFRGIDQ